jgi:hypothetical protein
VGYTRAPAYAGSPVRAKPIANNRL